MDRQGRGKGNSSKLTYVVPATALSDCHFTSPLMPVGGLLMSQVGNPPEVPQAASVDDWINSDPQTPEVVVVNHHHV